VFCGGEALRYQDNENLKIICLNCGKDFIACREDDLHRFHKLADTWHD